MNTVRLVILAKAPLPGLAKTRLAPLLGENGAADLAVRMLEHTLSEAVKSAIGDIELSVSPSVSDPAWQRLAIPASLTLTEQINGDLGERMEHIARRVISNGESIIMIGTDCPQITADVLIDAALALDTHDCCIIPVSDGGYALLGLNRHLPELFSDIPWSTGDVAFLTIQRIRQAGLSLAELPMLHDIDVADDLKWLPESWQQDFMQKTNGVTYE